MSLPVALARIAQLETAFTPPAPVPAAPAPAAGGVTNMLAPVPASASPFASTLQGVMGGTPLGGLGSGSQAMVSIAEGEVGQAEQPPGSNDSPRIAMYRSATAGSEVGPWCAYFVSWVARQAGMPLGDGGQGFGSVDQLYSWAQRVGRAVPNGPGVVPQPGDLVVFHEHIGIVERVLPGGQIQTIEGNCSNAVTRMTRSPGEIVGYVRMGG